MKSYHFVLALAAILPELSLAQTTGPVPSESAPVSSLASALSAVISATVAPTGSALGTAAVSDISVAASDDVSDVDTAATTSIETGAAPVVAGGSTAGPPKPGTLVQQGQGGPVLVTATITIAQSAPGAPASIIPAGGGAGSVAAGTQASEPVSSGAASEPAEGAPSGPAASEPAPSEPAASEPAPSEPAASEPAPTGPAASEPAASVPIPSAPAASAPAASAPAEPVTSVPAASAPAGTAPAGPISSVPAPSAPASEPAASTPIASAPVSTTLAVSASVPGIVTSVPEVNSSLGTLSVGAATASEPIGTEPASEPAATEPSSEPTASGPAGSVQVSVVTVTVDATAVETGTVETSPGGPVVTSAPPTETEGTPASENPTPESTGVPEFAPASPLNNAESPGYFPAPFAGRISNDRWTEAFQKARTFVSQLTLAEKVNLTSGTGFESENCVGNTGSVPRLGFWGFCLQDSPLGPRMTDLVTAFPPGIAAGATFNKGLIHERGRAMAKQFRDKGIDVMLGPVVGPMGVKALAGRNWEGFGADAYLQGTAGGLTVRGIQEMGVMANAKHFIGNEQETFRMPPGGGISKAVSSNIDDRALHEVYGWPFMDLIHEGVVSFMCSYNEINNTAGCQNSYLLNNVLKTEYGFPGFVMSDWGATKSGVDSVIAGLDMNMPGTNMIAQEFNGMSFFGPNLTASVLNGTVPEERLDDMAIRIMAGYYFVGRDEARKETGGPNFNSFTVDTYGYAYPNAQQQFELVNKHVNTRNAYTERVALDVAIESSALVKNTGGLPVSLSNITKIGVIGVGARPPNDGPALLDLSSSDTISGAFPFGGGSGVVNPSNFISPLEAINSRAAQKIVALDYYVGEDTEDAFERVVKNSDVNFIFGIDWSAEGFDRTGFQMAHNVDEQIAQAAELNSNNVVVITATGQVDVERWIDHPNITAVLYNVPQGAYGGEAIARILFGEYNPSGRLPFTVAKDVKDYVPIVTDTMGGSPQDNFDWGLYYDYRLFDQKGVEPRFEFGAGLSYSKFELSNLAIDKVLDLSEQLPAPPALGPVVGIPSTNETAADLVYPEGFTRVDAFVYPWLDSADEAQPGEPFSYPEGYKTEQPTTIPQAGGGVGGNPALWDVAYHVKADVTNHGPLNGAYVVQLYLGIPQTASNTTPLRQLRGFNKVALDVGQSATINFDLLRRDLSIWDVDTQTWVVPRGQYDVYVGSSSRNLELHSSFIIS